MVEQLVEVLVGLRRGKSDGRSEAKHAARQQRATHAAMSRHQRQHGGPPPHILARQAAERSQRAERFAIAAATQVGPPNAAAMVIDLKPSAVPSVALRLVAAQPMSTAPTTEAMQPPKLKRAALRRWTSGRVAAAMLIGPFAALTGLLAVFDHFSTDTRLADARFADQFASMTPTIALAPAPPAITPLGTIQFAALHLPLRAPDVEPPPPVIVPALPAALKFELAEDLRAPTPGSITLTALSLPSTAPALPLIVPPPPHDRSTLSAQTDSPTERVTSAQVCTAPLAVTPAEAVSFAPGGFGVALAAAALKQTEQFVIYDARYTRIAYPAGDVSSLHGVCTDVVIRAYRALGIDLQELVHRTRAGSGDSSIDHRRTDTLRRFFAQYGDNLPLTAFAEDYQPGDIVTYYRPQNKSSTSHIAVVSDVLAPSGRPMIIHNRGHGVQLEDGLFVDKITGHYRYHAPVAAPVAVNVLRPPSTFARIQAPAKSLAAGRLALRLTGATARTPMTAVPQMQAR